MYFLHYSSVIAYHRANDGTIVYIHIIHAFISPVIDNSDELLYNFAISWDKDYEINTSADRLLLLLR